jgi:signal transduction histidine kinase
MRLTSRFLRHYKTDAPTAARLERVLAVGRAFLTATALITIYLDPNQPERFAGVMYGLLLGYAIYSSAVLVWIHSGVRLNAWHPRVLHALDVVWASVLTFIGHASVSPFFLFFLFAVAASAFRWGFRETVVTAATTIGIYLTEIALATRGPWHSWFTDDTAFDRVFLRTAYVLLTAFLFGFLAEQEKQSRAELTAIADLPSQVRLDLGLRGLVTAAAQMLLRTFDARSVAIVLSEQDGHASLWRLVRQPGSDFLGMADRVEITEQQRDLWLFNAPGPAWHAKVSETGTSTTFWVSEPGAWRLNRVRASLPFTLTTTSGGTLTAVDMVQRPEWRGRIYLFDVGPVDNPEQAVHFLERVGEQITAALTNVFLHRRLQSQESAAERARVARELHDGAIQALYGLEMKLEALRRRPTLTAADQQEVTSIRDVVRGEAMAMRELMHALRPVELDANEKISDVLVAVVERFRRESGISARVVVEGAALTLGPEAALELVRIVQESLVNVRKHSRARNVLVRLTQEGGGHRLVIEDDGCGFEFAGRLSAPELDARRAGPAIIKERARILGATLAVESAPGVGARIELTLAGNGRT